MKSKQVIVMFAITIVIVSLVIVSAINVNSGYMKTSNKATPISPIKNTSDILTPMYKTGNFIMWTNDGKNLIWGTYKVKNSIYTDDGKICSVRGGCYLGEFKGQDNTGKIIKGYFNQVSFYGYYENSNMKFSGTYNGNEWKATGLFGRNSSNGEFKFFPDYKIISVNNVETVK